MQTPETDPRLEEQQDRDQDPESVKEDKIYPQVEPAGRVQVRTAQQPIGTEGHPATVQLAHAQSDLQEVPDEKKKAKFTEFNGRLSTSLTSGTLKSITCSTCPAVWRE